MRTKPNVLSTAAAIAKGMGITLKEMMSPTVTEILSRRAAQIRRALPRRARAAARRQRHGKVRGVLSVRRRLPGQLHLHRGGGEHREGAHFGRRALRQGL